MVSTLWNSSNINTLERYFHTFSSGINAFTFYIYFPPLRRYENEFVLFDLSARTLRTPTGCEKEKKNRFTVLEQLIENGFKLECKQYKIEVYEAGKEEALYIRSITKWLTIQHQEHSFQFLPQIWKGFWRKVMEFRAKRRKSGIRKKKKKYLHGSVNRNRRGVFQYGTYVRCFHRTFFSSFFIKMALAFNAFRFLLFPLLRFFPHRQGSYIFFFKIRGERRRDIRNERKRVQTPPTALVSVPTFHDSQLRNNS